MIVCATEAQMQRLCEAIDAPHLLDNPKFATTSLRSEHHDELAQSLNAVLRHRSRAHWTVKLDAANVPNAPVHTLPEMMVHEQTLATGMLEEAPDGTFSVVGLPIQFDGARRAFDAYAPELGSANKVLGDVD